MPMCSRGFTGTCAIRHRRGNSDTALIRSIQRYLAEIIPALYNRMPLPSARDTCVIARGRDINEAICYMEDRSTRNGQTHVTLRGATTRRDVDSVGIQVFVGLGDNDPVAKTYLTFSGTVYFVPLDQPQNLSPQASAF